MGSAIRFSVLLPTHNRADVLPFAIRSVLKQTVSDLELLIVGDGCSGETAAAVNRFNDDRIHWFDLPKAPNFGYANRNIALRKARGQYIAFMAHDDLWLPDHLDLLTSSLEQEGVELAYSRPLWVIPKGKIVPISYNLRDPLTLKRFLTGNNSIPAACVMHRRSCLERYGYWDETLPEWGDRDMWARIIKGGNGRRNFNYCSEPTCLHFRANWRTEDTTEPLLKVWSELHELPEMIPSTLKIAVPADLTEQEATWMTLMENPQEWTRQLRADIHQVLDRRVSQSDNMMLSLLLLQHRQHGGRECVRIMQHPQELALVLQGWLFPSTWELVKRLRSWRMYAAPPGTFRERLWNALRRRLLRL